MVFADYRYKRKLPIRPAEKARTGPPPSYKKIKGKIARQVKKL